MENNAQPEEHGRGSASESADTEPKRRKVSAAINRTLEAWFRRRELPEDQNFFTDSEEDEEDDDAPEHKKKTGKFRNALRAFFGTQVTREEIQPTPLVTEATHATEVPSSVEAPESSETTSHQEAEVTEPSTRFEMPFDPLVAAQYEQGMRAQEPAVAMAEAPTPDAPRRNAPTEWALIDRTQEQEVYNRDAEQATEHSEEHVTQPTPEVTKRDLKRTETKRYYGNRHRKRDVRELRKQTKDLKDEQKQAERTATEQTKAQQQLRERLAKIETAFAAQTAAQKVEQQPPVQPEARPNQGRPTESVKEILAKREKPAPRPESAQMAQQARELADAHYETTLQPQTVMERVEQAAEQNIAIEGLFERRHEVKDEGPSTQQQNNGSGIGSSLPQAAADAPFLPVQAQAPKKQPNFADNVLSYIAPEYKQAARNGFFAAILLLAIILVIFFMR